MVDGKKNQLISFVFFFVWDEENDVFDYLNVYGIVGWMEWDEFFLIYDCYDIWKFDLDVMKEFVNLMMNGCKNWILYCLVKLDKEECVIDLNKLQLLKGFNEVIKGNGYYKVCFFIVVFFKELMVGNYMLCSIFKVKNIDYVIYMMESFE